MGLWKDQYVLVRNLRTKYQANINNKYAELQAAFKRRSIKGDEPF